MDRLKNYLRECQIRTKNYMDSFPTDTISPLELKRGALEYFYRGGKRLRPALLSLCAGALGGEEYERAVVPAMVSVELFHTFTLVHDDIIDNDNTRRGGKTVHVMISDEFQNSDYGRDVAILAGDSLHALSVSMLLECAKSPLFSPETVLAVVKMLEGECINGLLAGETNDTRMGLIKNDGFDVGRSEDTLEMMRQKTGVLFSYSAKAGAMLGLNTPDPSSPEVVALGKFATLSGIAFQLKDDILGVVSDEKTLGKPIGSDIREGKKTLILQEAYKNATIKEREILENTVGNRLATNEMTLETKKIFSRTGAIEKVSALADKYIKEALCELSKIPDSKYRELLFLLSEYMNDRVL